jgi:hypothetical protein
MKRLFLNLEISVYEKIRKNSLSLYKMRTNKKYACIPIATKHELNYVRKCEHNICTNHLYTQFCNHVQTTERKLSGSNS